MGIEMSPAPLSLGERLGIREAAVSAPAPDLGSYLRRFRVRTSILPALTTMTPVPASPLGQGYITRVSQRVRYHGEGLTLWECDLRVTMLESPPASKWLWSLPSFDPCP